MFPDSNFITNTSHIIQFRGFIHCRGFLKVEFNALQKPPGFIYTESKYNWERETPHKSHGRKKSFSTSEPQFNMFLFIKNGITYEGHTWRSGADCVWKIQLMLPIKRVAALGKKLSRIVGCRNSQNKQLRHKILLRWAYSTTVTKICICKKRKKQQLDRNF